MGFLSIFSGFLMLAAQPRCWLADESDHPLLIQRA
jgi:hypothetical protein